MINSDFMNMYESSDDSRPLEPAQHPARRTWWGRWIARRRERRAYAKALQIVFW